jgi:hypothetical protein
MGKFGRDRVVNQLEWHYEAPKLLRAYEDLFRGKLEENTELTSES